MHVVVVTGTRPQIIKTAPLLTAFEKKKIAYSFIHTGQHYSYEMAAQFIESLDIREPDYNLEIGSGTNSYQTYEIIRRLSEILERNRPDYLIIPGDTNSALAAALVGFKMDIATCHLEAGLRSNDMRMQEEVNRRLIDHGSAALFAPTKTAATNLESENVRGTIYNTGDTMYDLLKNRLSLFQESASSLELLKSIKFESESFTILTLHRRENVDNTSRLRSIIDTLGDLDFEIIFPIHPRTKRIFKESSIIIPQNIRVIAPVSYDVMMALVGNSKLLVTDSGGLQKEAYLLNTPCVTIRDNTEWVETLHAGANILASPDNDDLSMKIQSMWGKELKNDATVYGNGDASEKIANIVSSGEIEIKSSDMVN
jgi:UDP-N-acetylglucosamine 2-epimerase